MQASPPMCSGTFTLTCTMWEDLQGNTCEPPDLVGCHRAHSVSGTTDCTIYAGACVPNLAGTLGSMTCSYPYFSDVMSNNCSFEPCPDGNPPVDGQCGYVPPHDDPPPPVVFGCNNCTTIYLPSGCSTNPSDPNYDPACHFDHMDCQGHETGPAPICSPANQWCNQDNLCIGGPTGLGVNNYVNKQCVPIASGFGLISGFEKRFCDNQCGVFPSPDGGINDPCLVGINSDVTCSIVRIGSNNGYSGNSGAYVDVPACYNAGVGPNNPATFEVTCYSGATALDNANWQLVSLTSSLGGSISHNFEPLTKVSIHFILLAGEQRYKPVHLLWHERDAST